MDEQIIKGKLWNAVNKLKTFVWITKTLFYGRLTFFYENGRWDGKSLLVACSAGWLASPLTRALFTRTVSFQPEQYFSLTTIQSEQYFGLFNQPTEQALGILTTNAELVRNKGLGRVGLMTF